MLKMFECGDEAKKIIARAIELAPENAQLKEDLKAVSA